MKRFVVLGEGNLCCLGCLDSGDGRITEEEKEKVFPGNALRPYLYVQFFRT